jgi:hypothetical protein
MSLVGGGCLIEPVVAGSQTSARLHIDPREVMAPSSPLETSSDRITLPFAVELDLLASTLLGLPIYNVSTQLHDPERTAL